MLQENQKMFEKCRPDFLDKLQETFQKTREIDGDKVELDTARDGNSVLVIERDGQLHRLNSAFRPVQEADRWAAQYKFDYLENIIVMFGLGNGIFLRSLLKSCGKDDKVIVYEPSIQIFHCVLEKENISDIISDARVHLIVDEINVSDFYFLLEGYLSWRNIDSLCVCYHPEYKELYTTKCLEFVKQIGDCQELVNVVKHTDVHLAHATVTNYFGNMPNIAGSNILADFIGKIPRELPAIIVSAGPSLDKNIEELRKAKGKAFILAVDAAVNILLDRGIEFDAMICVDALKNPDYINREECKKIPFFCGMMTRPRMVSFIESKKIWIIGSRVIDTLYASLGHPFTTINIGGSVATAAFATCEKLGFKKIVLIGQDLAYGDGVTHAGGVVKNVVNEEVGQQEIDAWGGGTVRSRYDWIIYRNWFENEIQQLTDVQVIDATEGGALIHGTETMTLADVIDAYCTHEFSMKELLEKEPPTFDEKTYEEVRNCLLHLEKELDNVRRSSEDAVIVCDEVLKLIDQCGAEALVNKQAKKLGVLNDKISLQNAYQLMDYYITDTAVDDLKGINQMTGDKKKDLLNTYLSAKAMYESLIQAAKDLKIVARKNLPWV